MKKFLVTVVLACATAAFAQTGGESQGAPQQQTQTKTIKDTNEYNAFESARTQTDPAQRAAAFEAFLQQYPSSVVKEEALVGAMSAYQAAGNVAKMTEAATKVLQPFPNNIPAIAVSVFGNRQTANSGRVPPPQAQKLLGEASQLAQRGLAEMANWKKPEGISDADFEKQKTGISAIFHGAIGQDAINKQDWPTAQQHMRSAVENNPNDFFDVYFTGVAYLSPKQNTDPNLLSGLWFAARAAGLAPNAPDVAKFGQFYYKKFHGSLEGWDQLIAQARTQPLPPSNFTVTKYVPPTPAQQAAEMVAKNDISKMDFGQWIFILTSGNADAASKVWSTLQGKALRFAGQVTEASKTAIGMAVTADGIQANKTEVMVTMLDPLKVPPTVGSEFKMQAVPTGYTAEPFLIQMEEGVNLDKPAAKPAAKKAPARKPTRKR
jgi:hypothetical protein